MSHNIPSHNLKKRLKSGDTLVGSLLTLASADVAEVMALVGFDYLWIDLEHGAIDITRAQSMVQAAGNCPCLVRVPENREVWIKKALDLGCAGLIVPQVQNAAEARAVVASALYPPRGQRSVGITRAQGYGISFGDYVRWINDELLVVVQVEHQAAVEAIDSIVEVPGIDCVFVGPFDLSASLGVLGEVTHPVVQEAIEKVRRRCEEVRLPVGIFATDADAARAYAARGFRLIAVGMDARYLWTSAKATLDQIRA